LDYSSIFHNIAKTATDPATAGVGASIYMYLPLPSDWWSALRNTINRVACLVHDPIAARVITAIQGLNTCGVGISFAADGRFKSFSKMW